MERRIARDAGIVDQHVDRTEVGLDLLDAGGAGVERTDVPFVDGDAGLGFEFFGGGVVAKVTDKVSIFATGDYTTNLGGDKRRILEGNLGISVKW